MTQLPSDVESIGYIETSPFKHEQVFYSKKHDFQGTEKDFIRMGYGYEYNQVDRFTRCVLAIV
jgi:hypothetical protein